MWLPSQINHICIVGGGNAAQVISALLTYERSEASKLKVSLLAPFADESERLLQAAQSNGGLTLDNPDGTCITGMPDVITKDPSVALKNAQLVLLPLPLFAIPDMCRLIAPYLTQGAWVGMLPAQGGVQWIASSIFGLATTRADVKLFGLDKLPYNCRTIEYGKRIRVFGYKVRLGLASIPNQPDLTARMATTLSAVIPKLQLFPVQNFLVATLSPSNQCIHPARMYSLFKDKGKRVREENPMFYDMNEEEAGYIQAVSDETQAIARGLEKTAKKMGEELELSTVLSVGDAIVQAYDDIEDMSSLAKTFSTCEGFKGIGTPMKTVERNGKTVFEIDWRTRYFTEDIPALCVLHGLGEIVGVDVPMIDKLIYWAQPHISEDYAFLTEEGVLNKDKKKEMYTPQYWGIETKEQLINFHAVKTTGERETTAKRVPEIGRDSIVEASS